MISRSVANLVKDSLEDTPVVMIVGPRQSGKSTLALQFESPSRRYVTLDDPDQLQRAKANPSGFLEAWKGALIIDEIQRAPELLLPIKARVDRNRVPGSYLLTGSANVLALPKVSESLAGRMEVIDLLPLSQAEINSQTGSNFVDWAFSDEDFPVITPVDPDIYDRVSRGGYPEPFGRKAGRRAPWYQSYIRTLLERDVRDLANIEGLTQLPRVLKLIASGAGATLNVSTLSRETGIAHTTVTRYIDLLKALYLVDTLPAWSADLEVRLARTPKAYLVDSGLSCFLCNLDADSLRNDDVAFARQLEVFVANELRRLITSVVQKPSLLHLRTVKNKEVPFVLEGADRRIVGIDVIPDLALPVNAESRLEYLESITEGQFHRGILLYGGKEVRPLTSKITAAPYSLLWST